VQTFGRKVAGWQETDRALHPRTRGICFDLVDLREGAADQQLTGPDLTAPRVAETRESSSNR